jgi:hypothetical protein
MGFRWTEIWKVFVLKLQWHTVRSFLGVSEEVLEETHVTAIKQ